MPIEIYNVDCMEYLRGLKDNSFDLAIVDPPYGIGESGKTNKSRTGLAKAKDYGNKNWDQSPMSRKYFYELFRVSKNQVIWGANHFICNMPYNSSAWIVWDKQNGSNDFADCELAWTSFKTSVRKFTFRWAGMLQGDMKNKEKRIHPTQKPVKLYSWILNKYAQKGQKILDTHLGSGSSAIAAHYFGCNFVGCEIDKEYYDDALKRIRQETRQLEIAL